MPFALALAACRYAPLDGTAAPNSSAYDTAAFFSPAQAYLGRPFYPRRVAEQADPDLYAAAATEMRFTLETHAIHFSYVGSDHPLAPRSEWAVPLGVVDDNLAVLTSRCEIDYKYPLREGQPDARFRNLAIFNAEGREPRTVFMLAPIPDRPELSDSRDPKDAHWFLTNRFYLSGPEGDRYFDFLAADRIPRVRAQLVQGDWNTNDGIDLVMLYFPLGDPGVTALSPSETLGIQDPMGVVRAAMVGRTDYLQTFNFDMITPQCLHSAEAELQHEQHEAQLWRGIAFVAAAAVVLPLLGPMLAAQGGLAGFAATMTSAAEQAVSSKILAGVTPAAWRVAQRALSGEQLADVVWDEGGRLILHTIIDGSAQRLLVAGVHRGSADDHVAKRILATVRAFVRERPAELLKQSTVGHPDVVSLFRDDVGVDLAGDAPEPVEIVK